MAAWVRPARAWASARPDSLVLPMFDPYHKWLGIPPDDQPPNHYRLLGINPFESDPDVIANAAEQRMAHVKRFETGKHSALSQALLNQLAQAKVCLLNPLKKQQYDEHLRRQKPGPGVQVAGRVWRLRWPPWERLWQSDRFWQAASTIALICILSLGCFVVARARAKSLAQATPTLRRLPPSTAAPAPAPSMTASSTASAPIAPQPPRDGVSASATVPVPAVALPARPPQPSAAALRRRAEAVAPKGLEAAAEPPTVAPNAPGAAPFAEKHPGPVYLDDLEELSASVGWGELGKHGQTGYPAQGDDYGNRGLCRGNVPNHMLSLHPPEKGTAFVSYALQEDFRLLRATVGILEVERARLAAQHLGPFFTGRAFSPLTFRVIGNGKVLWESRPIQKCGDWQECSVGLEGVRMLELHVHCPGPKTFAWAAWVDPLLER